MFLACDHHSVCVKIAFRGDFLQRHGTTTLIPNKHTPYPKQARLTRACFLSPPLHFTPYTLHLPLSPSLDGVPSPYTFFAYKCSVFLHIYGVLWCISPHPSPPSTTQLSKELTEIYGKGFTKSYLYNFVRFYKTFPNIFQSPIGQSKLLSWTHYNLLLDVSNDEARAWYADEAYREGGSVRTMQRNISSQYYHRMLLSQHKEGVREEMKQLTAPMQTDKLEFIKNPVVAEFLGLAPNSDLYESKLESAILAHIQKFVMELGKGYAFVARQQHIRTDMGDFYIDLVFYNYILKCFLLIDLKTSQITHQDVGQMDMYVRMYDQLKRTEGDNPTIGLVLCADTSEDMARYSVLHENPQLFQAKYVLYLPTKEELAKEIEQQKAIYMLQHGE